MKPLVELIEISKEYEGRTIVDGVSFKIKPSTINVLVGPNGAGKSTIAKILLGIESSTSGKVIKKDNLKLSYVPQGFKSKYEIPVLCSDFIAALGLNKSDIADIVFKNSDELDKVWNSQLHTLSGGYIQSLLLAIAFAQKPDLIILDEPTAYLDIDAVTNFYKIIEEQRKKQKLSILIISHDLHSVIGTADQVLCINHHLCCSGKPFKALDTLESNIGVYKHKHDHHHHTHL